MCIEIGKKYRACSENVSFSSLMQFDVLAFWAEDNWLETSNQQWIASLLEKSGCEKRIVIENVEYFDIRFYLRRS